MRHLTVYNRFAMIIAVLTVVFVAALAAQVVVLRNTVIEERRTKVFDLVEAAKKILSNYEEKAKAGKMSAEEAGQLAFDAIGAMRWGKSDRKSTRLNSSHVSISYAVFCLKKKNNT